MKEKGQKEKLETVVGEDNSRMSHSFYNLCLSSLSRATKNTQIILCVSQDVEKGSHPFCKVL